MKPRILWLGFILTVFACLTAAQNTSVTTSLRGKTCRKLSLKGRDVLSREQCSGIGGYSVEYLANEDIDWIELITPAGRHVDLGVKFTMPGYLAPTIEWRLRRGRPVGLIVRY